MRANQGENQIQPLEEDFRLKSPVETVVYTYTSLYQGAKLL
jgi:hypothetical protein